jgi:hypothetical protein
MFVNYKKNQTRIFGTMHWIAEEILTKQIICIYFDGEDNS